MTSSTVNMTPEQLCDWLDSIVNGEIFASRERLITHLAEQSTHEALVREFREFFNGYYVIALALEEQETSVLSTLKDTHLKRRVAAIEMQRKTSPLGREARRMGLSDHKDPEPKIVVAALSPDAFRELVHTLADWQLFASRERLVKLMKMDSPSQIATQLRAEFLEFFVCYLELEQFLEDYDYDPDDGLALRPEFIEELNRSDAYIKSGGKTVPLEKVAKGFGVKL